VPLIVGHVGGLSALFLGASLITVVELVDIVLCARASSDRKHKSRDRKLANENASSNHVTSLPVAGCNHRESRVPAALKSATLPPSSAILSNNKSANCSAAAAVTLPRQKVVHTRQAETDI